MTISSIFPRLFQNKPIPGSKYTHGRQWKNIYGHDINMAILRKRHDKNQKLIQYKFAVVIHIVKDLAVPEIKQTWSKIARKLRNAGVIAWWIREVSKRSNRVHYHLIVASNHTPEQIKQLVRAACPSLKFIIYIHENKGFWANYCCKSTTFAGKASFHASKVVLFETWVSLEKHNEIGDFWQTKPKKRTPAQNQAKRERTHKLAEVATDQIVIDAAALFQHQTGIDPLTDYANNIVTDPSIYQTYVNDAYTYRRLTENEPVGDTPTYGPFHFTPCPPVRKPPVRKKKNTTPKPPPKPWTPADTIESIRS